MELGCLLIGVLVVAFIVYVQSEVNKDNRNAARRANEVPEHYERDLEYVQAVKDKMEIQSRLKKNT